MSGELGRKIRASIRPEALEVIERHRAAGHRTVLVSGALDVLIEPLADLFDEVMATHMDVDESGVMTGYLATPPLRSEEHTSELQSRGHLVCRLLLEKKMTNAVHAWRNGANTM